MTIISYLTTIDFEDGAIARIGETIAAADISAPLIVTDHGIAQAGLLRRLLDELGEIKEPAVFMETPTNPTEAAVHAALDLYRAQRCDGVVAIGGGSPIDLAKAVALLATHDGPLAGYAAIEGGVGRITSRVAPVVAVPTTAGTGSEVGRAALITLSDGRKLGFISPHLIPRRAICDPGLTLDLPPALTAATGMDAVTHCVETYLSPRWNPPAEAIALDGLARAVSALPVAVRDGSDRWARCEMMMAALEGGLTFQKGLGAVHALSHPLGGLSPVPLHHGTLNAILLPAVLRFNAPAGEEKYRRIREVLHLEPGADLAVFFGALAAGLGLPERLGAIGVEEALLPAVAAAAIRDHSHATNPREAAQGDYLQILRDSF